MARPHDEGAERGETYLRLMAETCLRRALTYPPYDGPARPLPGGHVPAALSAPVAAVLRAALPGARALRRASQPLAPAAGQAAHTLGPLGNRAARALMPLAWRAAHTVRRLPHPPRRFRAPPAMEDANRVWAVADALVAAGVLDETTAASIMAGLHSGLALRSRASARGVYAGARPVPSGHPGRGAGVAGPALPGGPVAAIPVGISVPSPAGRGRTGPPSAPGQGESEEEHDGRAGPRPVWHLLTLVLTPGRAVLTVAARQPRPGGGPARPHSARHEPPEAFFGHYGPAGALTVTDDRGATYQLDLKDVEGGMEDGEWQFARFAASPAPPPGTRWLDLVAGHGADPVRVDLLASAPAGGAPAESLSAHQAPGERVLDGMAEGLLRQSLAPHGGGDGALDGLAEIVTALETAGVLPHDSEAVGRLVTLAQRLGIGIPGDFPSPAPAGLPGPWNSILSERHRGDGPVGVAPAAAVLPVIGGSRFVLAGLHSGAASATLHVLGWGWDPGLDPRRNGPGGYTWHARDDAGRWHTMGIASLGEYDGEWRVSLTVVPPLHPAATSLEVIVTGREAQARVTVPLGWQGVAG